MVSSPPSTRGNLHPSTGVLQSNPILVPDWISGQGRLGGGIHKTVTDRVRSGWSCNLVTFLFSQLLGPRSAVISRMKDEVQRVYSTLLTRVHRKPRTASADELPVLIGVMDLPVHKHNKASGPMVLCNGGLHVHALLLMPPTSRLKGSLADHFLEKRDLYVGPGKPTVRIDVRPVVEDHAQASRIALTGFSPTSVSVMAALIRSAAMSAISL
jgi:hypothetical protein